MFTFGLDMFLRTGFLENTKELFRTGDDIPYQIYSGIYGMLGVLSFTFLLGYLLQPTLYVLHKRRQRRRAIPTANDPYRSQYGSQYDSRDHLGVPQNQGAPAEYTWYGTRKNPPVPANNTYSQGYNEKGYQPVYSQNNLYQPPDGAPVAQNAPVVQTAYTPVVQTAPTAAVASSSQTQPAQINGAATTTGDNTIV